jgi:hypothetical protein
MQFTVRQTLVWFLVLSGISLAIHSLTIGLSPVVWQDEVQIVDYGRDFWDGYQSNYSITYHATEKRPLRYLSFVGCAVQELAYRVAGNTFYGPRSVAILGSIFASFALLGLLGSYGLRPLLSLTVALGFQLDPIFAQGYRGARIDAWTIGWMLLACWLIRFLINKSKNRRFAQSGFLIAGVCVGIAGLTWVSAILLIPLLIYELISADTFHALRAQITNRLIATVMIGIASIATIFITVLIAIPDPQQAFSDTFFLTQRSTSGRFDVVELLYIFKLSPFILLFALCAVTQRRQFGLTITTIVATFLVFKTSIYIHRAMYLLPYFYLAAGLFFDHMFKSRERRPLYLSAIIGATLLLFYSATVTLAGRSYTALAESSERDARSLIPALKNIIPKNARVALNTWSLYYVARELDWLYFLPYDPSQPVEDVDFFVFDAKDPDIPNLNQMRENGYEKLHVEIPISSTLVSPNKPKEKISKYGPYIVYTKKVMSDGPADIERGELLPQETPP